LFVFLFSFFAWSQEGEVLSLRDCVRIALDKNVTVKTYENIAQSASNNVKASYSNILPSLDVSYRGGRFRSGDGTTQQDVPISIVVLDTINGVVVPRTETIGFTNQEVINPGFSRNFYNLSFDVNQNIFDGGNWWNAIKQSKADRAAADYNYNARTNEVVRLVSQYFFDLLKQVKFMNWPFSGARTTWIKAKKCLRSARWQRWMFSAPG
jgi:outer membrane protein TolC